MPSRLRWRKRFVVTEPRAIDYSGLANRSLLVPDCGPQDRAAGFADRFHWSDIQIDPTASPNVRMTLASTTLLVNDNERHLVGLSSAFDQAHPKRELRFDPEGVRVGQAGQFFVSDQKGPSVCEFSSSGKLARRFKTSAKFRPTKLSADPAEENSTNKAGRQANGGFEGLALTPDGKKLFAFTQRPLLQDSQPNAEDPKKQLGIYNRILEIDAQSGATREFVYPREHSTHGVSDAGNQRSRILRPGTGWQSGIRRSFQKGLPH